VLPDTARVKGDLPLSPRLNARQLAATCRPNDLAAPQRMPVYLSRPVDLDLETIHRKETKLI
jgi:hypothetical protein